MYMRDELIRYWLCYSQYHFSIWLLNCNDYSDISSVCQTTWRLATVASHVAYSIQDALIWLVEVPLAANSRKGELALNRRQCWPSSLTYICGTRGDELTHWGRDKMDAFFADDTFKRISFNENIRISIKISLKFVRKGPINNNPALVQIMAWRRSGDKPLSEPMMISLPTHICVTRPQWVNEL